jgi:transcriptional regulator with XRE-family HTH domain
MYINGWPQADIAAKLGVSQQRVSQICANIKEFYPQQDRAEAAWASVTRLDRLIAVFMVKAMKGDNTSARTVVKLEERKARLTGLDAQVIRDQSYEDAEQVHYILEGSEEILGALK